LAASAQLHKNNKEKSELLKKKHGLEVQIAAISGRSKGSICDPDGLDLELLLNIFEETGSLESYLIEIRGL
jgi:hypothetical protein